MTSNTATKGGLERTFGTSDAGKAAPFIVKSPIGDHSAVLAIPSETKLMKTKGGELHFYRYAPNDGNHVTQRPEWANYVQFPGYRVRHGSIQYGEPEFYAQNPKI